MVLFFCVLYWCIFGAPVQHTSQCHDPHIIILSLRVSRVSTECIQNTANMGKNRTTLTSCRIQRTLLRGVRPETIPAETFDVANDNAAIFTNPEDFTDSLKAAVDEMILKGYRTFKAGSCFADLAARRSRHASQYSEEHFIREARRRH